MAVVIDRSKWLQGEYFSFLLRPRDGRMCCLGFVAKACGATNEQILGKCTPSEVPQIDWPEGLANVVGDAMCANDEERNTSSVSKEVNVSRILAKAGVAVIFTGKYPESTAST